MPTRDTTTRAWSITGPYGSGKSAFALFTAQLLSGEEEVRNLARKLVAARDADLSKRLLAHLGRYLEEPGDYAPSW